MVDAVEFRAKIQKSPEHPNERRDCFEDGVAAAVSPVDEKGCFVAGATRDSDSSSGYRLSSGVRFIWKFGKGELFLGGDSEYRFASPTYTQYATNAADNTGWPATQGAERRGSALLQFGGEYSLSKRWRLGGLVEIGGGLSHQDGGRKIMDDPAHTGSTDVLDPTNADSPIVAGIPYGESTSAFGVAGITLSGTYLIFHDAEKVFGNWGFGGDFGIRASVNGFYAGGGNYLVPIAGIPQHLEREGEWGVGGLIQVGFFGNNSAQNQISGLLGGGVRGGSAGLGDHLVLGAVHRYNFNPSTMPPPPPPPPPSLPPDEIKELVKEACNNTPGKTFVETSTTYECK